MPVIAHIADTHLGHALRGISAREEAVYRTFERLIDTVERNSPDIVLIAGDLFEHHRPKPKAMRTALELLKDLTSHASAHIVAVSGNHEIVQRRGSESPLRVLEAAGVLTHLVGGDSATIDVNGTTVHVTGHHWLRPDQLEKVLPGRLEPDPEADVNVAVLHLAVEGTLPSPRETVGPSRIPPGFDYYALGHVHEPNLRLELHGAPACYPGSPEPRTFKEASTKERGFLLVEADGEDVRIEFIPVEWSRSLAIVRIKDASRWRRELETILRDAGKDAVVKVVFDDPKTDPSVRSEVESYLEGRVRSAIVETPDTPDEGPSDTLARLLHNALSALGVHVNPERLENALSKSNVRSLRDVYSHPETLAETLGVNPETVAEAAKLASGSADPTVVISTAAERVSSRGLRDLDPHLLTDVAIKILESDSVDNALIDELMDIVSEGGTGEEAENLEEEKTHATVETGEETINGETPGSGAETSSVSEDFKDEDRPKGPVTLDHFIKGNRPG